MLQHPATWPLHPEQLITNSGRNALKSATASAAGPSAEKELPSCKNCLRFTAAPYLHSFSASLDQCKNQSWQTANNGWIVTPTSTEGGTQAVAESAFCSGDCLFSYLFSNDLLSNQRADVALHFFKRVDAQRPTDRYSVAQSPHRSVEPPVSDALLDYAPSRGVGTKVQAFGPGVL